MIFGKIDYINLLPFHFFLKQSNMQNGFKKSIEYNRGIPSKINNRFLNRKVDAAFISSIKSTKKNIKTLPVGIVAQKKVKSVLVKEGNFKPDKASATSNVLANILQIKGEVLIGDHALKEYIKSPENYMDLAEIWYNRYGLPFVFAVFCTNKHHKIYKKIAKQFAIKKIKIPEYLLEIYSKQRGISKKEIKEYLKLISYKINRKEEKALKLFLKKARALGLN